MVIEAINEDIGVNESGHGRRDPLFSTPYRAAVWFASWMRACDDVLLPDRTDGVGFPDLRVLFFDPEE